MVRCINCNEELIVGKNWNEYQAKVSTYKSGSQNYKICKECHKKRNRKYQAKQNAKQMYVNGKYIPITHPLHKPGKYKTFSDAAFSSLINYVKCVKGEVYIINNPAWKDWYKIGKAVDTDDRCNGYQTSSPHRDYAVVSKVSVSNRGMGEKVAHELAEGLSKERSNEWFRIENLDSSDFDKFLDLVKTLTEEKVNGGTSTNTQSA